MQLTQARRSKRGLSLFNFQFLSNKGRRTEVSSAIEFYHRSKSDSFYKSGNEIRLLWDFILRKVTIDSFENYTLICIQPIKHMLFSLNRLGKYMCMEKSKNKVEGTWHTVITPVAALTPASPNAAVAASVTNAVAAILTTLCTQTKSKIRNNLQLQVQRNSLSHDYNIKWAVRCSNEYSCKESSNITSQHFEDSFIVRFFFS